jgi:hypothetical protein
VLCLAVAEELPQVRAAHIGSARTRR